MATIKDIANRLGISVGTVSKGLNGASDISEQLRQSVLDTAVEMGYTPKQMRAKDNRRLCIFIENMDYETPEQFGYDIILGFKQLAYRERCDVTVIPVTPSSTGRSPSSFAPSRLAISASYRENTLPSFPT